MVETDETHPIYAGCATAASTISAAPGARPIITNADGTPPYVVMRNGTTVTGLWFGGTKDTVNKPVNVGANVTLDGCVFFGYYGALGMGDANNLQVVKNCRFINCGHWSLYHSIYISNSVTLPENGIVVEDNIFIGGEAWHMHLWHDPINATVRRNFSAAAEYCLALQGSNHVFEDNVLWQPVARGYPVLFSEGPNRDYRHNFHGPIASGATHAGQLDWFGGGPLVEGVTLTDNYYMAQALKDVGATMVTLGDEVAHLGKSVAEIDAAQAAIQTAFAGSAAAIHADATITPAFGLLAGVTSTWAA